MSTTAYFSVPALLALSAGVALGQQAPRPTEAEFLEQVRLLAAKDPAARLGALSWLGRHFDHPSAADAVPALERCVREDPDKEVRQRAVSTLAHLAKRLDRPCPLAVAEALLDPEDFVRWEAAVGAQFLDRFSPACVGVMLRGAVAEKADIRSHCLLLLARAAGKDPKALAAMEKATADKVFDVRDCARLALFRATDKLEGYLAYLIRVREDPAAVLSPGPADSEVGKQERVERNMILIGSATSLIEWSETRTDEMAAVLLKLLADDSAVLRRGAATVIGLRAGKVDLPPPPKRPTGGEPETPAWIKEALEQRLDPNGKPKPPAPYQVNLWELVNPDEAAKLKKGDAPREKSKLARRLEELKVQERLRKLRDDDPDRTVRDAARAALERLAAVNEAKP